MNTQSSFLRALSTSIIGETHNGGLCGAGAMIGASTSGNPCSLQQTINMNTKVITFMDQNRSEIIVENHFMLTGGGFMDVNDQIKKDHPEIKTYEGITLKTCLEISSLFFEIVPTGFNSWEEFVYAASGGDYVSVTQGNTLVKKLKSTKREWWGALHFCGYAAMERVTIEIANGDKENGMVTSDLIRHSGCSIPESGKADATIMRVDGNHFVTVLCPDTVDAVYLEKKGIKLFTAEGYLKQMPFFANDKHGNIQVSKLGKLLRLKSKSAKAAVSPPRMAPAGAAGISPPTLPAQMVSCCTTYPNLPCCCCRLHLL
jgi:hypothetical protein